MFFCITNTMKKIKNKYEKEEGSFLVPTIIIQTINCMMLDFPKSIYKRILLCITSKRRLKSSITVEASFIIPIFLFGMLCIIYLLEILAIQMAVKTGMHELGYLYATSNLGTSTISNSQMEDTLIEVVGKEKMDGSIIVDGSNGIDLSSSQMDYGTGVIQLVVKYEIALPIPYFINYGLNFSESLLVKR